MLLGRFLGKVARKFCDGVKEQDELFLATEYDIFARSNMNCFLWGGLSRQPLFPRLFVRP